VASGIQASATEQRVQRLALSVTGGAIARHLQPLGLVNSGHHLPPGRSIEGHMHQHVVAVVANAAFGNGGAQLGFEQEGVG
jgi:hypothetical protein